MTTTTEITVLTAHRLAYELPLLAETIHATNVEKGWWDKGADRDQGEMIALQVSELAEALEEDREGHDPVWFSLNGKRVYRVRDGSGADWTTDPDGYGCAHDTWTGVAAKPEGAAVELVDCAIRLMDHLGFTAPDLLSNPREIADALMLARQNLDSRSSFGAKLMVIVTDLASADRLRHGRGRARGGAVRDHYLLRALIGSLVLAEDLGTEPFKVCRLKMAYNDTRAFRHGGKAY